MFYIALGFFNGLMIGLSRVVNSRLGQFVGSLASSVWNHVVGLVVLLTLSLFITGLHEWDKLLHTPWYFWTGGLMGALFVTFNSYLIPKIGAFRSIILIVAGEMIGSAILDFIEGKNESLATSLMGATLIILGVSVKMFEKKKNVE